MKTPKPKQLNLYYILAGIDQARDAHNILAEEVRNLRLDIEKLTDAITKRLSS